MFIQNRRLVFLIILSVYYKYNYKEAGTGNWTYSFSI